MKVLTVTDLHQNKQLYSEVERAVELHKPDLVAFVGDFLNYRKDQTPKLSEIECAQCLARLPGEVIFVRGNHERENWWTFADAWRETGRPLHSVNGAFVFGPLVVIGFPSLLPGDEPFLASREPLSPDVSVWMPACIQAHGRACRTLWLMHEPPCGTALTKPNDASAAHREWREAIEHYQPKLVISGHDHKTPIKLRLWQEKIGETTCINLGQTANGPLHYLLIELSFDGDAPRLPKSYKLTPSFYW